MVYLNRDMGIPTTGVSALRNGRFFAGIDINKKVADATRRRLERL
jgi:DNA modification methylase